MSAPADPHAPTPRTDPDAAARAAAAELARRTGVERHDVAVVLGSGWAPGADALGPAGAGRGPARPARRAGGGGGGRPPSGRPPPRPARRTTAGRPARSPSTAGPC